MSGAVAFLAGLGTGYLNERDRRDERSRLDAREQRQREREDAADARAKEIYGFQKSEREQATADRAMLREAAKPVSVVPEATMPATMDARDIGQPGEAPVPVTGYKVGANRFASQGLAEAEAGRQRDTRLGAALDQVDPMGAQSRRTAGLQGQAAQLQLSEAQQAAAAREWTRKASAAIVQSGSWDAATKFMTESKADGLDGSSQWGHQVSPDGKTVSVYPKGPNGAPLGKGFTLPNDEKGRLQLLATLDQSTPVMAKLADIRAEERAATERADKEADNKRADAALALQADGVKAQRAQLGMQMQRFKLEQRAADMDARIPPAVKMQHALFGKELDQIGSAMTKAMAEGSYDPANKGTQELLLRQRELTTKASQLLAPYLGGGAAPAAASGGDPLGLFKQPPQAAQSAPPARPAAIAAQGVQPPAAPDRFAGMSFSQRQQAIASNAQAMAADQDLQRLNAEVAAALRSGQAEKANAIKAQLVQLRAERYGQ